MGSGPKLFGLARVHCTESPPKMSVTVRGGSTLFVKGGFELACISILARNNLYCKSQSAIELRGGSDPPRSATDSVKTEACYAHINSFYIKIITPCYANSMHQNTHLANWTLN